MNIKDSTTVSVATHSVGNGRKDLDGIKGSKGSWEGTTRPPVQPEAQLVSSDADTFTTSETKPPVNLTGT